MMLSSPDFALRTFSVVLPVADVPQMMLSPASDVPQMMLSSPVVPQMMLSPSAHVPQMMLSPSSVPQMMLSLSSVPQMMLSLSAEPQTIFVPTRSPTTRNCARLVPQTMLSSVDFPFSPRVRVNGVTMVFPRMRPVPQMMLSSSNIRAL